MANDPAKALAAKLNELDAARYRYLRNTPPWKCKVNVIMERYVSDDIALLSQDGLDAVIDAALSPQVMPVDPWPDNEADGVVFCGKCGHTR